MLEVSELKLAGVRLVSPKRFEDARGYFVETFNAARFASAGLTTDFVQDNQSGSIRAGTLRGLHYQAPPYAQAKLVRALTGRIYDVAVDARVGSPTYGHWAGVELSAENGAQLFVPRGFLHGFLTLEDDTHVAYKVDAHYDKDADGAVAWNSPALGVDWGVDPDKVLLSDKDAAAPDFSDWTSPFVYETADA